MIKKRSQPIFIVCALLGVLIPGIALYFQLFPFNQKDPIQIKKPEKFTALNLTKHVKENGILQINLSSTSNDNDQIRYIITNDPQNGSLSFVKPDFYFYQPNKGFIG